MLYNLYESQRSLMEPLTDMALAASKAYSNPMSIVGQSPFAHRISATYALMHRMGKDYEKPEFGLRTIDVDGVDVAIHERVEISKPFCELRRFKRFTDDTATLEKIKNQPAVLIVAPLSGHYATLLRDTVKTMLKDHKVYITDWKNARLVPLSEGEFHLDDYVNYVQEFIRHLQGAYGNCHVMSVCQPTVPVLAAVSLMASRGELTPLSMTMMGGPIDARKSPTAVNNLAVSKSHSWFENNVIYRVPSNFPGAGRRVYPGFMQHAGFVAMNPDHHAKSHYDYFRDLIKGDGASTEAHTKFYDEYNAVLDIDAGFYLDTIKVVFQDFCLVNGTWDVKNPQGKVERVRPEDIKTTALLSVEGELDDISGSGQTRAVHDICTGVPRALQSHYEVIGSGHYGIFAGRRWRELVYPQIKAFIYGQHLAAEDAVKTPAKAKAKAAKATAPRAVVAKKVVKAAPKVAPQAKPKAAPKAAPKATVKATAKTSAKVTTKAIAKPAPKAAPARAKVAKLAPKAAQVDLVEVLASDATPAQATASQPVVTQE